MKCPVCNSETNTNICPACGYDRSLDLESNPSLSLTSETGPSKIALLRSISLGGAASADVSALMQRIGNIEGNVNRMLSLLSAIADKLNVQEKVIQIESTAQIEPEEPCDVFPPEDDEKRTDIRVGDTVTFGRYLKKAYGNEYEDLDWIAIYADSSRAVLISKDIIEYRKFFSHVSNPAKMSYFFTADSLYSGKADSFGTWYKSDIRKWLNNKFCSLAFSKEEQAVLMPVMVSDDGFKLDHNDAITNATDKVFLLNVADYIRYRVIINEQCEITPYAQLLAGDEACWWLNTSVAECANRFVSFPDGELSESGCVHDKPCGVRPVICVSISGILIS